MEILLILAKNCWKTEIKLFTWNAKPFTPTLKFVSHILVRIVKKKWNLKPAELSINLLDFKKIIYNNHKLNMKSYKMAVSFKLVNTDFPSLFLIPLSLFPLFPLHYMFIFNVILFPVMLVLLGSWLPVKLLMKLFPSLPNFAQVTSFQKYTKFTRVSFTWSC